MPKMIGNGSIYYNEKTKKWKGQYILEDDNKKQHRKSFTSNTKNDAYSKMAEIRFNYDNKNYIQQEGVKLIDLLENYRERKYKANIIGEAQYYKLQFDIKRIKNSNLGQKNVADITTNDLENFLNELNDNYSASTIEHTYQLISAVMNESVKHKYILDNPCSTVLKPKSKNKTKIIHALTKEEQKKLNSYLMTVPLSKEKYKNALLMQLYMGLRIGEALSLKKEDIDLKNRRISINKTLTIDTQGHTKLGEDTKSASGNRDIIIPDFLLPYVEEQYQKADENSYGLLFYNNHLVRHSSVNSVLKRICNNLEIYRKDLSTHVLRHTFATRCIEGEMPPSVLQKLMGHANMKVTMDIYVSVDKDFKEKEIDKISKYYANNNLIIKDTPLLENTCAVKNEKNEKNFER